MTKYKGYTFEYHYKFKKEFHKILKKHQGPTLKSDFQLLYDTLIKYLENIYKFPPHLCMHIAGLEEYVSIPAFIIKIFRCEGINKGANSGFRITFLFDREEDKFIFVEFFNKNKKDVEDKICINKLFNKDIKIHDELYEDEETCLNKGLL